MWCSTRRENTASLAGVAPMRLVDAHCHFDFPEFDQCRLDCWSRAEAAGLWRLVVPGVRAADWGRVREVALQHPAWFYCLGVHPWYVEEHTRCDLDRLQRLAMEKPAGLVALGECGLDRLRGDMSIQWGWFEAQVAIAKTCKIPLVVHSVRAHDEVAAVLRRLRPDVPVLIHGFAGSYQQASNLVALGCYLGVGGAITHERARKTRDAVARLPLEALVLETDAPDMAPAGCAPGHNEPSCVRQILTALASLRGTGPEALAPQLLENACHLYGWGAECH